VARWEAEQEIKAREKAQARLADEENAKRYVALHPKYMLVRREGGVFVELRPQENAPAAQAAPKPAAATQANAPEPGTPERAAIVRERIVGMIREAAPELTMAYNEAMKKNSEEQARKKPAGKETLSAGPDSVDKRDVHRPSAACAAKKTGM
jgi:hypothetical protein